MARIAHTKKLRLCTGFFTMAFVIALLATPRIANAYIFDTSVRRLYQA